MTRKTAAVIATIAVVTLVLMVAINHAMHCSLGWISCVWPTTWWYELAESDQASWAEAIGTLSAVIVALAIPTITAFFQRRAEAVAAKLHARAAAVKVIGILNDTQGVIAGHWLKMQNLDPINAETAGYFVELRHPDIQRLADTLSGAVHFHRAASDALFDLIPELDDYRLWLAIEGRLVNPGEKMRSTKSELVRRVQSLSNRIDIARETIQRYHLRPRQTNTDTLGA